MNIIKRSVNLVRCCLLHVLNSPFITGVSMYFILEFFENLLFIFILRICPAFLFAAMYRYIFKHVLFSVFKSRLTTLSKSAVQTTHFSLTATYLYIHQVFFISTDKKPTCSVQIQWKFLFLVPPDNVDKTKYQWLNNIHLFQIILNKKKIRRMFSYTCFATDSI
jgi:hypothetical protein